MTWLSKAVIIFSIPCLVGFSSCRQKPGDPQKFSELTIDQLTEKNTPKGLWVQNGEIRLQEGYDIVHNTDSTAALFIDPEKGKGMATMHCDCDGLISLGCIIVREGIITCKSILCNTRCNSAIRIYEGPLTIDQIKN